MSRLVPAFQIGQNFHRKRSQIWTAFHLVGRPSRWESACCDWSKSSPICPWSCLRCSKNSCHLILTENRKVRRVAAKFVQRLLTCQSLSMNFRRSMRRLLHPAALLDRFYPADFFLFPNLKSSLKGRRFQTAQQIEENRIRDFRVIPQNTFQKCKKRWKRRTMSGGEYVDGDGFD